MKHFVIGNKEGCQDFKTSGRPHSGIVYLYSSSFSNKKMAANSMALCKAVITVKGWHQDADSLALVEVARLLEIEVVHEINYYGTTQLINNGLEALA